MPNEKFYSRQTILKEVGIEGQQKLHGAKVLIVGAGGLGHPVGTYLAAAGVGELNFLDFDKVEESNLNRQVYFSLDDLSEFKAEALTKKIKKQNPYIKVNALVKKLTSQNARDFISGFDLIVDCCDNFATKFLIHDWCWKLKKNLVQASIYQYEGQIQVFNFTKNSELGCLRCLWPEIPERGCTGSCEEAGLIGAVAGAVGSLQAMESIKLILDLGEVQTNCTITIDLLNLGTERLKWKRDLDCRLCSAHGQIKDLQKEHELKLRSFEINDFKEDEFILFDIREDSERADEMETLPLVPKPLSRLDEWKEELEEDHKYLFICSKGLRSYKLVQDLRRSSNIQCFSLHGGLLDSTRFSEFVS